MKGRRAKKSRLKKGKKRTSRKKGKTELDRKKTGSGTLGTGLNESAPGIKRGSLNRHETVVGKK